MTTRMKLAFSLVVILVAIAATVGGTMAWFTDTAEITPNVFTAGTIMIEAGESWAGGYEVENWNPGDCEDKDVWVEITGSKRAYLRMQFNDGWFAYDETEQKWVSWTPDEPAGVDPIKISLDDKAFPDEVDHWVKVGEWYYYMGVGDPATNTKIDVISEVCLIGALAGNQFQGKRYELGFNFEAIQVTHEATFTESGWGVSYIDYDDGTVVANGWYPVNMVEQKWTMEVDTETFVWSDPGYDADGVPYANHMGWTLQ